MPSLSKLILLSNLLLSGALSLPFTSSNVEARDDGRHVNTNWQNPGLTRGHKREAEDTELAARDDGRHVNTNWQNPGLTRGHKREAEDTELAARDDGRHVNTNWQNPGLTR